MKHVQSMEREQTEYFINIISTEILEAAKTKQQASEVSFHQNGIKQNPQYKKHLASLCLSILCYNKVKGLSLTNFQIPRTST
jgi:hypothetical protein